MPILIKAIPKVNPHKPSEPQKWYVTQVTTSQVDETQVATELADETTLNPAEAIMAIRQLRKILLRRLLSGESVKLGNWGSFSVAISSMGVDTKEQVSASNIKSVNLTFRPDEAFKADLQKAQFAWVDKLAKGHGNDSAGTDGGGSSDGGDDEGGSPL
ncbi:HU family DNA-binding protein [uncultured Bacteroides sp.]|uniref:HU family DNA-binding protein n=1 Tax=uncultured Bacteroides sp. TaxID=162156 RepID=UPI002623709A|nr:HU family DNA-binding protein [uncultured Bacteroides sp.]